MNRKFSKCVAAIWLSVILLLTASCGNEQENTSSVVDVYRTTAQEFIDAGDYDSAIQVLEEGIAATNNESLAAFLEDVKALAEENNTAPEDTQSLAPDDAEATNEPAEPTEDVTDPVATETPSSTTPPEAPAESEFSTEAPSATLVPESQSGRFDHLVGTWQDEYGDGFYLCIGYSDASKQHAYAHVYTVVDFEVELTLGEGLEGEESAYGYVGHGSEPEYTINLYPYKWWLEADINYCAEGVSDSITFYPADMDANPPVNPYYTG